MAFDFDKYKDPTQKTPVTNVTKTGFDFSKYKDSSVPQTSSTQPQTNTLTPKGAPSFTDWMMEQAISPLKQAGEGIMNFGGGTLDVFGKTAQGDFMGALQGAGRTVVGLGQIATAPMAPAINAAKNIPQFVQDTIQTAKPSFEKTLAGAGQVGRGFQQGNMKDVVYGGAKALSGGIGTVFSPVGGMVAQLPREIQQGAGVVGQGFSALRGAVPALTGQTGTETGEFMGDVFDIGMTVLPFAAKGITKAVGKTKAGQLMKEGGRLMKQDITNGYTQNIKPNLEAIGRAVQKPVDFAFDKFGTIATPFEKIAKMPPKAAQSVKTYFSSPEKLAKGVKAGSADVQQLSSKLGLPTYEIKKLQKYTGDKDFIKQVNIADQNLGKRTIGEATPLRVPAKDIINAGKYIESKTRGANILKSKDFEGISGKRINLTPAQKVLSDSLSKYGGTIKNGKIKFKDTSVFNDNPAAQKVISNAQSMLSKNKGIRTLADVEEIRQSLYNQLDNIDPSSINATAAKKSAQSVIDSLRQHLANEIETISPKYKLYNQTIAKNLQAVDEIKKLLGIKDRFTNLSSKSLRMEELSGQLLGKAADRKLGPILKLYDRAVELGYKGNKEALLDKIKFADALEDITGTAKRAGLQGTIEKGIQQTADKGLRGAAIEGVISKLTRSPEARAKLSTLRELLKTNSSSPTTLKEVLKQSGQELSTVGRNIKSGAKSLVESQKGLKPGFIDTDLLTGKKPATKSTAGSKAVDPLLEEAKKYKSAEDFVKSQPKIYHFSPQKFKKFDLSRTEEGSVWFTDNPKISNETGLGSAQANVSSNLYRMDRSINPNIKIADINLAEKYSTDELRQMGFSGIKVPQLDGSNWYEIFNPNIDTLTKSQLETIWKKTRL